MLCPFWASPWMGRFVGSTQVDGTEAQENDRVTELVSVGGGRTKGTSWCLLLLSVWRCQRGMLERQEAISARKVLCQKFSHLSGVVLIQIQGSWENLYP